MSLSTRGFIVGVLALVVVSLGFVAFYLLRDRDFAQAAGAVIPTTGDATAGRAAILAHGCTSCHEIAGIRAPGGRVGPSLVSLPQRHFLAGELANTPTNLRRWIMTPQRFRPGSAMPNLGVGRGEAEDIAAYLYLSGERR